jgi:SWIM zinc finger
LEQVQALLVHSPAIFRRKFKEEFLDKMNDKSVLESPKANPFEYNFKKRLQSARHIPKIFVKEDDEGGYTVFSSELKKRYWKHDRTRYHYHIFRTTYGQWLCTCQDFAFHNPKPCKHILRVILYKNGLDYIIKKDNDLRSSLDFCLSDELRNVEGVFDV